MLTADTSSNQQVAVTMFPPGRNDLATRLAAVTQDDTVKGLLFNGALAVIQGAGGGTVTERCRDATGERRFVDFSRYPAASFLKLTYAAAEELGQELGSREAVFERLGRRAAEDFLRTAVGKTLLVLAGSDPRRLLVALGPAYRTCVSYGDRATEITGDRSCLFSMRGDYLPAAYHVGLLLGVLAAIGAKEPEVRATRLGPLDASFEVSWK